MTCADCEILTARVEGELKPYGVRFCAAHEEMLTAHGSPSEGRDWDDDMRTLLRSWAACMQSPRPTDWKQIAANLYADTCVLLGELSLHEEAKGIRS